VEDLARAVAGILAFFVFIGVVDVLLAVLARRGKIKIWIGHIANTLTGLLAIFGISIAWALGMIPLLAVIASSITLTWPRRK
jgi:Na+/glutamate symporter